MFGSLLEGLLLVQSLVVGRAWRERCTAAPRYVWMYSGRGVELRVVEGVFARLRLNVR